MHPVLNVAEEGTRPLLPANFIPMASLIIVRFGALSFVFDNDFFNTVFSSVCLDFLQSMTFISEGEIRGYEVGTILKRGRFSPLSGRWQTKE